jgi:hypothetical protein
MASATPKALRRSKKAQECKPCSLSRSNIARSSHSSSKRYTNRHRTTLCIPSVLKMSILPQLRRQPMYWGPPHALKQPEVGKPQPPKLQESKKPEQRYEPTRFDDIKEFFLRIFKTQRLTPLRDTPRIFRLLDLPQELIDKILDIAISNEAPQNAIIIRWTSTRSEWTPGFLSALDSSLLRFPMVLPAIPPVFHLSHAIRLNLLRRHRSNILSLAIPGRNRAMRPWIYRHTCTNQLRLVMPVRLSSWQIALLMRYVSPRLVVQKALRISNLRRYFCYRVFNVVWRVDMVFVDGDRVMNAAMGRPTAEQPQTGGRIGWTHVFCAV